MPSISRTFVCGHVQQNNVQNKNPHTQFLSSSSLQHNLYQLSHTLPISAEITVGSVQPGEL
jgi:hypothetical protein